jgi:hypothetical protein
LVPAGEYSYCVSVAPGGLPKWNKFSCVIDESQNIGESSTTSHRIKAATRVATHFYYDQQSQQHYDLLKYSVDNNQQQQQQKEGEKEDTKNMQRF